MPMSDDEFCMEDNMILMYIKNATIEPPMDIKTVFYPSFQLSQLNMDIDENIVTLEQVLDGYDFIKSCPDVVRTPLISHVQDLFKETIRETGPDLSNVDLFMKMENMQTTGKPSVFIELFTVQRLKRSVPIMHMNIS